MERYFELSDQTPFSDEVIANYFPEQERIQEQNYKLDLALQKVKRCL